MTKDEVITELKKSLTHMKIILHNVLPGEERDFEYDRGYKEALEYALSYVKKIAD